MNEHLQDFTEQWLRIATGELCDDAQTLIRAEVEEHVSTAFGEMRNDGVDALTSARKAVDALGNPKSANRRYRRYHLTDAEDRRLTLFGKTSRSTVAASWGVVLFTTVLVVIDRPHTTDSAIFYLFFLTTTLVGAIVASWLQYAPHSALTVAKLNAAQWFVWFVMAVALAMAMTWRFISRHGWSWLVVAVMVSVAAFYAITVIKQIRILTKLSKSRRDRGSC